MRCKVTTYPYLYRLKFANSEWILLSNIFYTRLHYHIFLSTISKGKPRSNKKRKIEKNFSIRLDTCHMPFINTYHIQFEYLKHVNFESWIFHSRIFLARTFFLFEKKKFLAVIIFIFVEIIIGWNNIQDENKMYRDIILLNIYFGFIRDFDWILTLN